jgi:hypothetical protein
MTNPQLGLGIGTVTGFSKGDPPRANLFPQNLPVIAPGLGLQLTSRRFILMSCFPEARRFRVMVATHLPTLAALENNTDDSHFALQELAGLIDRVGQESLPGMILRQAQNELLSVLLASENEPVEVVGPLRFRVA